MGQNTSQVSTENYSIPKIKNNKKNILQHEGILRYSHMPFTDSQKLQIGKQTIYVERTRMNVKQLIRSKQRIKKIFQADEILKIIQDVAYTLAIMQQKKIIYPLMTLNNIYFSNGRFKLMPPEIIESDIFQLAKQSMKSRQKQIYPLSPQMIIALRCHEDRIQEDQILNKSNVFSFGMLLLEICTLKPYTFCYDQQNFDILNQVINERLSEIEKLYPDKITRIVANMLDYDFQERFSLKQLSIWVNREMNESLSTQKINIVQNSRVNRESQLVLEKELKNSQLRQFQIIQQFQQQQPQSHKQEHLKQELQLREQQNRRQQFKKEQQQNSQLNSSKIVPLSSDRKDRVWQKIKRHKQMNKSKSKSTKILIQKDKNRQFLPNPYLNKSKTKADLKPNEIFSKNYQKILINNTSKCKYSYSEENQNYSQKVQEVNISHADRNRNSKIDLKYKYNINQDPELSPNDGYSPRRQRKRSTSNSPRIDYHEQTHKNTHTYFDGNDSQYGKIPKSCKFQEHKMQHHHQQIQPAARKWEYNLHYNNEKVKNQKTNKQGDKQEVYWKHLGSLGTYGNTGVNTHAHRGRSTTPIAQQREKIQNKENRSLKFVQQEIAKSKKILAELRKSEDSQNIGN